MQLSCVRFLLSSLLYEDDVCFLLRAVPGRDQDTALNTEASKIISTVAI